MNTDNRSCRLSSPRLSSRPIREADAFHLEQDNCPVTRWPNSDDGIVLIDGAPICHLLYLITSTKDSRVSLVTKVDEFLPIKTGHAGRPTAMI